ncbi:hypothetical protein ACLEJW_05610 [Pseudomonas sp. SMSB3]|uniref:ABC-three component system protein n=1 Tax=Pseudomonas sp. SMSB3 TaxID=3390196 RepID=UPI003F858CE7
MTEPGASHSAAGYGYQYERALYRILHSPNASTRFGIETADDVEQISKTESGSRRVSEQAKLVVKPRRNALQDASPNLWKTLRIWLRGLPAARVVHEHLEFVLVTNRPVKDGSLAKRLSNATDAVDVASVISALHVQAGEMTGKTGQIAAEVVAFNDGDLSYLIKRMQVHDSQDASALRKASIEALRLPEGAVEHSQKIYDGLIGFLFRQCQQKWERQEEFWTDAQPFYNQLYSLTQDCLNAPIEPLPLEETGFAKLMSEIHRDDMRFMHQLAQVELDDDMALTQFSYFCGAYSERVRLLATGNI